MQSLMFTVLMVAAGLAVSHAYAVAGQEKQQYCEPTPAFNCASTRYSYNSSYFPNSNNDNGVFSANRSSQALMKVRDDITDPLGVCGGKSTYAEVNEYICIHFFPPCLTSSNAKLLPVRVCETWCRDMAIRCGPALKKLNPGRPNIAWPDCTNSDLTTCYYKTSGMCSKLYFCITLFSIELYIHAEHRVYY